MSTDLVRDGRFWGGVAIFAMAASLLATALIAPTTSADVAEPGERWEGTWRFDHEFGGGTMQLCEQWDPRNEVWLVWGVYGNAEGGGKIRGVLTQRRTVWTGTFNNSSGNTTPGPHRTVLAEGGSFVGTWKSCRRNALGFRRCEGPYDWNGDKIDRTPNGRSC
jgi:hypothetical protein